MRFSIDLTRPIRANKKPQPARLGPEVTAEPLESRTLLTIAGPVAYNVGTTTDQFVPNAAPISVVSKDVTGDGKLDLLVTHTSNNTVNFLKGNGDGTFQPAVAIPVGQAIQGDIFVGDFNGDGKADLFLPGANSQPIIMLGNGNGTFGPAITSSSFAFSGYYPRGWAVGDFNGDGKLDVVCTLPSNSTNTGRYMVLLGNGNGTFQTGIVGPAVLGYSRWVTTGDFNRDGKLDLAIADGQGTSGTTGNVELTILLGNGDGTFALQGHYPSPQLPDGSNTAATANPEDVVVADVNHDGKLDAIESDYDNTINVFLGNGDGTFQPARSLSPGNYPRSVVPVDLNGDGNVDLVVTNVGINSGGALLSANGFEPGSVAVLYGNGDGTFQPAIRYSPSVYPGATATGDFNNDGAPDLATTQVLEGHAVNVMLDQPAGTNLPPVYVQSPSASPTTVTNNTTQLSALATDDGGESNLTYTWSTVGSVPAPVTYSSNGTNASKTTTATFTTPGNYLFQCAATDAQGTSIRDLVTVTVNALTTLPAPTATGPGTSASPGPVLTTLTPTLSWTGVSGVTGYQINLYNVTTQTLVSYQVGASVSSYAVTGGALVAGDAYVWNVRGRNGTQSGPPSVNLYFQAPAASTTPTLTAPTAAGPGTNASPGTVLTTLTPTLNWTGVSGITGYQINLYNVTTQTLVSYQVGASASSYTVATGALVGGDSYVWNVRGLNGTQSGPPSVNLYFQAPAASTTPTLTAPTSTGPGTSASPGPVVSSLTPTLSWTGVSGVTGYQINLYNVTTKSLVSYTVGASASSYTVATGALVAGDAYVWNVRGLNGTQSGPPSVNLYFQAPAPTPTPTPAPTPTPLPAVVALGPGITTSSGTAPTVSSPTLQWSAITGVTALSGYKIYLTDLTLNKTFSYQVGPSVTSYTPATSTLAAGDRFVWNVRLIAGTVSGPPSAYFFFQTPAAEASPTTTTTTSTSTTTSTGAAATRIQRAIASYTKTLTAVQAQQTAAQASLSAAAPGSSVYKHFASRYKSLSRRAASIEQKLASLEARL